MKIYVQKFERKPQKSMWKLEINKEKTDRIY